MRLRKLRRLDLPTLRAAWWALRAVRHVRRRLGEGGLEAIDVPGAPRLPPGAERGMQLVLARRRPTCLVRATVRQAWHAAHGSPRDLVIGVTPPARGFRAHAWLDGDPPGEWAEYHEVHRLPATRPATGS